MYQVGMSAVGADAVWTVVDATTVVTGAAMVVVVAPGITIGFVTAARVAGRRMVVGCGVGSEAIVSCVSCDS